MLLNRRFLPNYRFIHNWVEPPGFDTGIKIYNCVTKNKEPLVIKNKHLLTWYTCGPTVYDSSHIGHASCYMKFDIIQRILKHYFKCNLVTVMNITDIDDKIISRANQTNLTYKDIANRYAREFLTDLNDLGLSQPNIVLRVTDHIDLIVDFIKKLESTGHAYKATDNSVYFDVEKTITYGKLQNIGKGTEQDRMELKKSSMDFALWKSSKPGEPYWDSPWGNGRPGWHIECSALASYILGSSIDIHAGGIDLRFPHHENEEAQSCAFHETNQWVNYWLHTGHLHLKQAEKMSKSLQNTISIQEMLKTTSPNIFRLACVMSHYRSNMEYSRDLIEMAENVLKVYKNLMISCQDYNKGYLKATINNDIIRNTLNDTYNNIHSALADDFDTPRVISLLNELVSVTNSVLHTSATSASSENGMCSIVAVSNFIFNTLANFGITLHDKDSSSSQSFIEIMDNLNSFRQEVRQLGITTKDQNLLKLCDNIRDKLKEECDVVIKDYGKISSWSR